MMSFISLSVSGQGPICKSHASYSGGNTSDVHVQEIQVGPTLLTRPDLAVLLERQAFKGLPSKSGNKQNARKEDEIWRV